MIFKYVIPPLDWSAYATHVIVLFVLCVEMAAHSRYACYVIHGSDGACFDRRSRECWDHSATILWATKVV